MLTRVLLWAASAILWWNQPGTLHAASVNLIPVEDTTLSERYYDTAQGDLDTLNAGTDGPEGGGGRNRALLKFDLATKIPPNSAVDSVSLKLTVTTITSATNLWFSLHKVLTNWGELSATWDNRTTPPAPWSAPGGAPPADFAGAVSQSNLVNALGNVTFASSPGLVADVQDWVNTPGHNFGWMLICELETLERSKRKFGSREASTNNRPLLTVQYTPPPPALTLTVLPPTNGQFQFQFNAEASLAYTVLWAEDLQFTNWLVLTNIPPLNSPVGVVVGDALANGSNRYYRVRSP